MRYYIIVDGHRSGPFSLDELRERKITKHTLVWYDGLFGWTKAGEILELIDIVSETDDSLSGLLSGNAGLNNSITLQLSTRHSWKAMIVPAAIIAGLILMMLAAFIFSHPNSILVHHN